MSNFSQPTNEMSDPPQREWEGEQEAKSFILIDILPHENTKPEEGRLPLTPTVKYGCEDEIWCNIYKILSTVPGTNTQQMSAFIVVVMVVDWQGSMYCVISSH